jgi:hypothetical protein
MNDAKIEEGFLFGKGDFFLPLDYNEERSKINLEGNVLEIRDKFHVILVNTNYINFLVNGKKEFDKDIYKKALNIFKIFVKKNEVEVLKRTGEYFFIERGERKSVVERVLVKNIESLFEKLSEEFNINIPIQPTHVTI